MTPALIEELRAHKEGLLAELEREQASKAQEGVTRLRASFAQERLWFIDQLEGAASATYNVPEVVRVEGPLDARVLEQALQALVRRHESLRTTFVSVDGEPYQIVHPAHELRLVRLGPKTEADARELIHAEVHTPFDLAVGPLVRATLIGLHDDAHLFVLCIHHIVVDGWSLDVLWRELWTLYSAFANGSPSPLPSKPLDYADFAAWQRTWLTGDVLERQLGFWKQLLAGAPSALELPSDRPRPAMKQSAGDSFDLELPQAVTNQVQALCRREGATPFMVLLAAFQSVLSRWSGTSDIVVGTPIANRTRQELEGVVGFFANTLPLRTTFAPAMSFADVLRQVKSVALSAYSHQDIPFEKVVEELHVARDPSRTPVFQTMFVLQNSASEEASAAPVGLTLRREPFDFHLAKFDLLLAMEEEASTFHGSLEYDVALFDRATIERFATHFVTLLDAATRKPEERVAKLPLMGEAEQARLREWNATERAYERGCAHELFEAQARRTPDAPAITMGDETLSYAELNRRANRLAHHLRAKRVMPGSRVALCASRSIDTIAAVLAILKTGAAYVPVDPTYPPDRIELMLADAKPSALVTEQALLAQGIPRPADAPVVCLDRDREDIARGPDHDLALSLPDSIGCYVIYTSGSTGRPKGVMMPHRPLVNLMWWQAESAVLQGGVTLQFTPLSFDVSFQELFSTWMHGGKLVGISEETRRDPSELLALLDSQRVQRLFLPFVALKMLAQAATSAGRFPRSLECVVTAGEQLLITPEVAEFFARLDKCILHNHYGPSETHVVTAETLSGDSSQWPKLPSIGRAVANTTLHVLDRELQPVPIGVAGELYLGGLCLADGYFDRPELTADRFVASPFDQAARMYKTGDLVRYLPDGRLDYLGRADTQVKVRGFRVEPGEVETALAALDGVEACAVTARKNANGDTILAAYVVGTDIRVDDLRASLKKTMPEYMVPTAFVVLDALPLTPSGKVDRKALPAPDLTATDNEYVAPRGEVEEAIATIFREVLGLTRVGAHDDFFALGGHSLLATRVVSRARAALRFELPVRALFEDSTVARLAQRVTSATSDRSAPRALAKVDRSKPVPASYAQSALWFLDQLQGASSAFNLSEVVRLRGPIDAHHLERAVQALVARHETLRTTFVAVDGEPHQVIRPSVDVRLSRIDASSEEDALRIVEKEVDTPFDLSRGPLVRAVLVRISESAHLLALCIHHTATDGLSNGILLDELSASYAAFVKGAPSPVQAETVGYADFAAWQRGHLRGDFLASEIAFWRSELAGAPPSLELPTDRARPAVWSGRGASMPLQIDASLAKRIESFARARRTTTPAVLMAAYAALLSRYATQPDVTIGVISAARTHPQTERMVGLFANLVPMRTRVDADLSFAALVERVRSRLLAVLAHQDLPFDVIVSKLQIPRDLSRHPVFQAAFAFMPAAGSLHLGAAEAEHVSTGATVAKSDLAFGGLASEDGSIDAELTYAVDLFAPKTVARMAKWLVRLLDEGTRNPDARVADIELVRDDDPGVTYPLLPAPEARDPWTTHITRQAKAHPEMVAVVDLDRTLTFRDLDEQSERIASALALRGIRRGDVVALTAERRLEWIVGMVAINKALATYMPLDSQLPERRMRSMLTRASCRLIVNQMEDDGLNKLGVPVAGFRTLLGEGAPAPRVDGVLHPRDPAYIIFTSGSTGEPKGVVIEHSAFAVLIENWVRTMRVKAGDRVLQMVSTSFDVSMGEVGATLRAGGTVVLRTDEMLTGSIASFLDTLRELRINVFHPSAPFLHALCSELAHLNFPSCVHTIVPGGDQLSLQAIKEWFAALGDRVEVVNAYGPTEATVSCITNVLGPDDESIDIGKPFPGSTAYVLDEELRPVLPGAIGELWLSGAQLGRGYVNDPMQTAWRYIPDPFSPEPGARMYRTGDLARVMPNDKLTFIGRTDGQVKIRGYRIEIGEVVATFRGLHGVMDAVVTVREDIPGDKRLIAYFVGPGTEEEVRAAAREALPAYMMPAAIMKLDAFPIAATGKVDKRALPAPSQRRDFVAPRTASERLVAEAWRDVLHVEAVGVNDNFFDLGGHSLLATRLVGRLRSRHGVDLSLTTLFKAPTVAEMAKALEDDVRAPTGSSLVMMRDGTAPTVILVHAVGGSILSYEPLVRAIDASRRVIAFESGAVAADAAPETLPAMAARYVTELLAAGVLGPVVLVGWSMGGALAFEMAHELLARGGDPLRVVMLDTVRPSANDRTSTIDESKYVDAFAADLAGSAGLSSDIAAGSTTANVDERLRALVATLARHGYSDLDETTLRARFRIFVRNAWAFENHEPRPLSRPVILVRAADTVVEREPSFGWQGLANGLETLTVSGDHYSVVREPGIAVVAEIVNRETVP